MLVKYACDCIGFPRRDDEDESAFILQVCDNDSLSSRWHFQFRPMRGKTDTPLPIEESDKILEQIGQLVFDGEHLREMAATLHLLTKKDHNNS